MNKCYDCKYKHKGIESVPCCACAFNHEAREDFYIKDNIPKTREQYDEEMQIQKQEESGEPDYDEIVEKNKQFKEEIDEQIAKNQTDRLNETLVELEK